MGRKKALTCGLLLAMLLSAGGAWYIKIRAKEVTSAVLLVDGVCPHDQTNACARCNAQLRSDNSYGSLVETRNDAVRDALVDKVILTARESDTSMRNIHRRAILVRYPQAIATVVVSHGFMCDKFDVVFLRQLFPKEKYNILTFDYRAHGEDKEGQQCTFGKDEVHELAAAAQFVRNYPETANKPVYVYGFSMGAATSLLAQARHSNLFDAMVLDCPYDSTENIIKKSIDNLRFSVCGYEFCMPGNDLLKKYAFHPYVQSLIKTLLKSIAQIDSSSINTCIYPIYPLEAAKKITVPCFFIHCKNDDRVSVESAKRLYNAVPGVKKLWITNGRGHFTSCLHCPEDYARRLGNFLDKVYKGEIGKRYKKKMIEDKEDGLIGGIW